MAGAGKVCARCILPDNFPGLAFDNDGVCSECRAHAQRWDGWDQGLPEKRRILEGLCADARRKKKTFDALVPLSGGKDSTYVLYYAKKALGLNVLAYTLDNSYLTSHARENIDRACRILGVEHVYYCLDPKLLNELFAFFLRKTGYFCSVCLRAIGMATERVADMHDIPLVFGGTSARTELPLSPEMFQSGPVAYMKNVLKDEPILERSRRFLYAGSLKRRVGYRLFWWGNQRRVRLCAWINLPDYVDWRYDTVFRTIQTELGWQSPDDEKEHTDCAIHPVTTYLHDRRFPGLEVRRLTLARLVMAGQMTRDEALRELVRPSNECPQSVMKMFLDNLGMTREEFERLVDAGPRHLAFRPQPSWSWRVLRTVKHGVFRTLGLRK